GAEPKAGGCLAGREEIDAIVQVRTVVEALDVQGSIATHAVLFHRAEGGLACIRFRRKVAGVHGYVARSFGEAVEGEAGQVRGFASREFDDLVGARATDLDGALIHAGGGGVPIDRYPDSRFVLDGAL